MEEKLIQRLEAAVARLEAFSAARGADPAGDLDASASDPSILAFDDPVRSLEAQGVPSKQSEAITSAITEILNDSLKNVVHSFVSKAEMQKEHHFSLLQHETEKLRGDIENMRSELRYEIDKVTAGQRLDLNLKKGRICDELANQNAETTNLTNKLDREIHALRAQLEAAQYEVIKYCIGTLVSISAVGLAVVRILM